MPTPESICCADELASHPILRLYAPSYTQYWDGVWVDDGGNGYWEFFPFNGTYYAKLYCLLGNWTLEWDYNPTRADFTECSPLLIRFDATDIPPWFAGSVAIELATGDAEAIGLTLFVEGAEALNAELPLVVSGPAHIGYSMPLVISGPSVVTDGMPLVVAAPNAVSGGLKFSVTGSISSEVASLPLTLDGATGPEFHRGLPLVTGGVANPLAQGLKLFVGGPPFETETVGLKLAIAGKEASREGGVPMVIPGEDWTPARGLTLYTAVSPVDSEEEGVMLSTKAPEGRGITFATAGPVVVATDGLPLTTKGAEAESAGLPLVILSHAPQTDGLQLYVHGF